MEVIELEDAEPEKTDELGEDKNEVCGTAAGRGVAGRVGVFINADTSKVLGNCMRAGTRGTPGRTADASTVMEEEVVDEAAGREGEMDDAD